MSAVLRRIIYVTSYELIAILLTTGGLVLLGFGGGSSGALAITASTVALIWNYIWSTLFDTWESRQASQTRTLRRRIAHAVGFEGGLVVFLLPTMAWLLNVSLLEALRLEVGLLAFFLLYTFVYAWIFDKVLPPKRKTADPAPAEIAS